MEGKQIVLKDNIKSIIYWKKMDQELKKSKMEEEKRLQELKEREKNAERIRK